MQGIEEDTGIKVYLSKSSQGQRPSCEVTNPGKSTLARTQKSHALAPGCCHRHAITRTCVQHDIFTIQTQIQIQVDKQIHMDKQIHIQSKQQQVGSFEWSTRNTI